MSRTLSAALRNVMRLGPVELVITGVAAAAYLPVFGLRRLLGRSTAGAGFRRSSARTGPRG